MKHFFITTAISYPNGTPHIGHAYELFATDVIARFYTQAGKKVYFLTGTDDHGLKMFQTARDEGIHPKELADRLTPQFRHLAKLFHCAPNDFIRTSQWRHHQAVKKFWTSMEKAGDIYLDKYAGWYSVSDESYYNEDELIKDETGKNLSPQGTEVEWVEEESYFFRLSRYQDRLLRLYEEQEDFIQPSSRRNEIISFVSEGLKDLSMSRASFDWGVKVPNNPQHIVYVWADALVNYLTACGYGREYSKEHNKEYSEEYGKEYGEEYGKEYSEEYGKEYVKEEDKRLSDSDKGKKLDESEKHNAHQGLDEEEKPDFSSLWPADVHIIGKDITRFHAVYWPAFLMSAGLPLPKKIFAHGFLTLQGEKMSKSKGNVVSPSALVEKFGSDELRYFFLREIGFGADGQFSIEKITNRINADLVNDLGNLSQRSLSMIAKHCDGKVPSCDVRSLNEDDKAQLEKIDSLHHKSKQAMADFRIHIYLKDIFSMVGETNRYFAVNRPWLLAKTNKQKMNHVLYVTAESLRQIGILLLPALPEKSHMLLNQLGILDNERNFSYLGKENRLKSGVILPSPEVLFPRIDKSVM